MLKALELVGFKSFADKTRFEFPPGITVVVGPNGSGKSNVVDAIKWVLGEQSVKSLRGKEMADVIFNGSGSRHPLNAAETTLSFDNSRGLLAVDTPEVHITRRVYRSGEGEYLINRQPCRLRDIRDLLAGTGIGVEAYSIIEQGRVDALLQSSPRDRRLVFEEAAGISRFKAKKVESLRRLERVDQNLLRLADIVEEVESRVRSVRLQASKARRYKELSGRLQELRTQVGLADWRHLTEQLAQYEEQAALLRQQAQEAAAQADQYDRQLADLDQEIGESADQVRRLEGQLADDRQRIAADETIVQQQHSRAADLEEEISRQRGQISASQKRLLELDRQLAEARAQSDGAQAEQSAMLRKLHAEEEALLELNAQLDAVRSENEQRRQAYLDQMRDATQWSAQITSLEAQRLAAEQACQAATARQAAIEASLAEAAAALRQHLHQQQDLSHQAQQRQLRWTTAQTELSQLHQRQQLERDELGLLRQRQSGLQQRAELLAELEERQEGLSAGVQEVLARTAAVRQGIWRQIRGVVADLFRVNVEAAPLIDVALGEFTSYVVVGAGWELEAFVRDEAPHLAGRVGFLRMEATGPTASAASGPMPSAIGHRQFDDEHDLARYPDLESYPGVLGRADRFVETTPDLQPLVMRLLGRTWLVERLDQAVALRNSVSPQARFVTLSGELLSADGSVVLGPRQGTAGLISRRSQLRALRQQLSELEQEISQRVETAQGLDQYHQAATARVEQLGAEHRQLSADLSEQRLLTRAAEEHQTQLSAQQAEATQARQVSFSEQQAAEASLASARAELEVIEAGLAVLESQIAACGQQILQLDERRQTHSRQTLAIRVELAKHEERVSALQQRVEQGTADHLDRTQALAEATEQLAAAQGRQVASYRAILQVESQLAGNYLHKEELARQVAACITHREAQRHLRSEVGYQAQRLRSQHRRLEEELHQRELAAGQARLERTALANRLRDDYGIELAELELPATAAEQQAREQVDQEIAELRRKLNAIGAVNLDALAELEQTEARFRHLSSQYQDLSQAKQSLEQIIQRINADSRRLFADTLETIRGHFQELFRKLFGGGQADIVLEEGVDILESGIDIVARPPGKEPRNISLLSGGEKTLTCVAMLLAIFRSRPSPFCVLDEVDAALDEANIERFVGVLREFLAWTQFIVVTHSKKTMSCASTLYGVTMQESGVSKRVAVRFEEVNEDGSLGPAAARRANDEEQAA